MNEAMTMDTVVTSLTTQLSAANLWGVVRLVTTVSIVIASFIELLLLY